MKQNFFKKVDIKGRVRVCLETVVSLNIKEKTLIDVGSSIGWIEKELIQYKPKKLIGVEPDAKAVAFAKKEVPQATFFVGSADILPVPSGQADIVIMFDVIEHVPVGGEALAFKEVARVLKKGGRLALSTPNSHPFTNVLDFAWYFGHRHYRKEKIKHLVERAGFKVESLEIRGGLWSYINLDWHYFLKWVLKKPYVTNNFLIEMDDKQFSKEGIHTIFLKAKKL